VIFLRTNAFDLSLSEVDAYQIVLGVAAGGVDSSVVAALFRRNISPSE
jgi:NH3-dependent NAD+ synthetase